MKDRTFFMAGVALLLAIGFSSGVLFMLLASPAAPAPVDPPACVNDPCVPPPPPENPPEEGDEEERGDRYEICERNDRPRKCEDL